jgi:hypothetical protein
MGVNCKLGNAICDQMSGNVHTYSFSIDTTPVTMIRNHLKELIS